MNREFLMLAKDFDPDKHTAANHYVSIKRDGTRCFWDGGISRGVPKVNVPYANNDKDERYKTPPVATGLWSRYGNVLHAPNWFLDNLPQGIFLDGELYLGRGKFQELRSIVSTIEPALAWKNVKYLVFDMPSPNVLFQAGKINNPNFSLYIDDTACEDFLRKHTSPMLRTIMTRDVSRFDVTVARMARMVHSQNETWHFMKQHLLDYNETKAREELYALLEDETNRGGEGLIIRAAGSIWVPKRVMSLLKVKKFADDEGVVIGYTTGTGKLQGKLGALRIQWNAKEFDLSGFTDAERELSPEGRQWAMENPGHRYPAAINISRRFPMGTVVRFRYMTLTDKGLPREARYWR